MVGPGVARRPSRQRSLTLLVRACVRVQASPWQSRATLPGSPYLPLHPRGTCPWPGLESAGGGGCRAWLGDQVSTFRADAWSLPEGWLCFFLGRPGAASVAPTPQQTREDSRESWPGASSGWTPFRPGFALPVGSPGWRPLTSTRTVGWVLGKRQCHRGVGGCEGSCPCPAASGTGRPHCRGWARTPGLRVLSLETWELGWVWLGFGK